MPLALGSALVLVTDTHVKHDLSSGEYSQRRASCHAASRILGVSLRDASLEQLQGEEGHPKPTQVWKKHLATSKPTKRNARETDSGASRYARTFLTVCPIIRLNVFSLFFYWNHNCANV